MPMAPKVTPKRITKYFGEKDLLNYERGSIKFGTLLEYRGREADEVDRNSCADRMSDPGEGEELTVIDISNRESLGAFIFPGIAIYGGKTAANVVIHDHRDTNGWVFCASFGDYDRDHHLRMKARNCDLTHYAIFDLDELCGALFMYWEAHRARADFPPNVEFLLGCKVVYDDRNEYLSAGTNEDRSDLAVNYQRYLRTVFLKPHRFEHEREIRILANLVAPRLPDLSAKPLFPASEAIKKSIKAIGSL